MFESTPRLAPNRRLRWGLALLAMVPPLVFGIFVTIDGRDLPDATPASGAIVFALAIALRIAAPVAFVAAVPLLWLGTRRPGMGGGLARTAIIVGVLGVVLFVPAISLFFGLASVAPVAIGIVGAAVAGFVLLIVAGILGAVVGATRLVGRVAPLNEPASREGRSIAGVIGAVGVLVVIAIGLVVSLVANPAAVAPGVTVTDSLDALQRSGDSFFALGSVFVWAAFWTVGAAILVVLGLVRSAPSGFLSRVLTPRRLVIAALWIAGGAIVTQWFSYFALGLSLADDLPGAVGGGSGVAGVVYSVAGVVILCVAIVLTIAPRSVSRTRLVQSVRV